MYEDVDIRDGYYGRIRYDKGGNEHFIAYGKEVALDKILQYLDRKAYDFKLLYAYNDEEKNFVISRGEIGELTSAEKLREAGIDVRKNSFDCFCDSIFAQEDSCFEDGNIGFCHKSLGWIKTKKLNNMGNAELCFRFNRILTTKGDVESLYRGQYKIGEMGEFKAWRDMVIQQVLPYVPLSIVLLCALSATTSALLTDRYPLTNGILNLCGASSTGKTTSAFLATSVVGEPFQCIREGIDVNEQEIEEYSILQSFANTNNALVEKMAGNRGIPIVLDEIGKYTGADLTSVIYSLADGNGKGRMNKSGKIKEAKGFKGTVITIGEISVFEKCKSKYEGLHNRIFELSEKLTVSAEHSETIKNTCIENNGWATPMLAKHILSQGGIDYVAPSYEKWKSHLKDVLPSAPFVDRFIETFPALYLTTAEIAKEALNLEFKIEEIIDFCKQHLLNGGTVDISLQSYGFLIKEFFSHDANFYQFPNSNAICTHGEVWGRYKKCDKYSPSGKKIVGEFQVRENIIEKLLSPNGYIMKRCIEIWSREGLIDRDSDRPTRKRLIEVGKPKERVFCFYIFENEEGGEDE